MTKKKSEKTEEKKVSEETVAEETKTENTEEPAKDENADKIKALEDELSAQKDKYMRLAAEYDNYRKRTANEKLSIYDDATSKACIELLPVADSVTLALANLKDADPDIIKGIELISNQLAKSFEKHKTAAKRRLGLLLCDRHIHEWGMGGISPSLSWRELDLHGYVGWKKPCVRAQSNISIISSQ